MKLPPESPDGKRPTGVEHPSAPEEIRQKPRRFRAHVGNYAWAEMVIAAIGLLSFPILTRLLSVSDYGTLNLVASALGVWVALGKLGMQHSALRGWAEVDAGHSRHDRAAYEATVLWGMAGTGAVMTLLWALLAGVLPETWWGEPGVGVALLLAAPLVLLRVMDSALSNLLRAQEFSGALAVYSSLRRLIHFVLVVGVLWGISRDLRGFFAATLVAEGLALLVLLGWMYRHRPTPAPRQASWALWLSLAAFGLPMLGSEIATVILTMGDRLLIQQLLGAEPLGIYAATYNMCDHLRGALLGALVGAAYPRCLAVWEREGADGLRRFLGSFLHVYAVVAVFMVALMSVIGTDVMVVLASQKYAGGGPLAGWIMAGLALQTVGTVAAVGIFIAKRTRLAMLLLLAGGVASMVSNLLLLPLAGLAAAGWAVLGSSFALAALQMGVARRFAPVLVPWRTLLTCGALAVVAVLLASSYSDAANWQRLIVRGMILSSVYSGGVLVLDPVARAWIVKRVAPRRLK